MLIFNGKEMPSKYTVSDDMILEVNSNNTLDEIYEALVFGADVSDMINVNAYKNGTGKVRLESDDMPDFAEIDGFRIGDAYIPRDERVETLEETLSSKANDRPAIFKAFESYQYGNATDGFDIKPINFNKTKPQHLEVLRKHIALARGVMPTLYDLKDENGHLKFKNLARMRKLSMEGDNLFRYYGPGSVAKNNTLPTLEEINDFQKLSDYEKRIVTNSCFHPAFLMKVKKALAENTNSKSVLFDNSVLLTLEPAFKRISNWKSEEAQKLALQKINDSRLSFLHSDDAKDLVKAYGDSFKAQIGRPPQILSEYVDGIIAAEGINKARQHMAEYTTKDYFSLKTMQTEISSISIEGFEKPFTTTVAATRNPGFIYLANKLKAQNYPSQLLRYLSTYVTERNIKNLIAIGFDKWIEANKNVSLKDLDNLFEYKQDVVFESDVPSKLASRHVVLDPHKSLKDICFEIKNARAIEDMHHYEEYYNYKFADNVTAIKGRHLCLTENGNKIYMLPDDDLRHFTVAYTENTHCCQHWGGVGASCVAVYTQDPYASCVVVEDKNGQIQAQGFVWVDVEKDCFVFDNIEYHRDPHAKEYTNLIMAYCKELPYSNVQIGMGFVESSGSAWGGVGKPIGREKTAPIATMPKTLRSISSCYSDYHPNGTGNSSARVVKNGGEIVNYTINYNNIKVTCEADEPTIFDEIADGPLKFMLNDNSLSIEERKEFIRNFMENPTKKAQAHVYERNPQAILSVENPDPELQVEMYRRHPEIAIKIQHPCPELQAKIVADNPEYISNMDNLSPELVEGVVGVKGLLLEKIPAAFITENVCKIAVENNAYALKYVPEEFKTPEVVSLAIEKDARVAVLYTDQNRDIQLAAARKNPDVILYFKEPTVQAKMAAVSRKPSLILNMKDPEELVVKVAIERTPSFISKYQASFPNLRRTAIEADPTVVKVLSNLTQEEYNLAVSLNPNVVNTVAAPLTEHGIGVSMDEDLGDLDIG